MSKLQIHQIPVLHDNYLYLIKDIASDKVAIVDPAVSDPVLDKLNELGWKLTHILNTHHHMDHTGANLDLKEKTGCTIVGSKSDASRIPGIDVQLSDGDVYEFGESNARIFDVSGHTIGHIAYWFEQSNALFCGDALFALGCGRLFEGTPAQMWESLSKLKTLPDTTQIYCAHEYTEANAKFALSVEPQNTDLQNRYEEIVKLRGANKPTVPSTLADEKRTNPFLRPDSDYIQETLGMRGSNLIDIFAEIRSRKDNF
ncbi:hydroxyacylglutathione hydrolase [Sneathiella glossodoripedis]|uniref:hydroxyacylglutathione hydrolase n=1 Tax=Sneathiella glossodoripedis TaxID=418853 RepID=UPI00056BAB5F|nr:hydroxyacylglutathione hydrolase [Sneathiella glossodoripedis]